MLKNLIYCLVCCCILAACGPNGGDTAAQPPEDSNTTANPHDTMGSTLPRTDTNALQGATSRMMSDMQGMPMTGDPDNDFAMMMKRHHEAAIEMSNALLKQGADLGIKNVAQNIITQSQREISQLDSFMANKQPDSKSDFSQKAMDLMSSYQPTLTAGLNVSQMDTTFATMMIQHHKQGMAIAKEYLKTAKEEQTRKVATMIAQNSPKDTLQLHKWTRKMKTQQQQQ